MNVLIPFCTSFSVRVALYPPDGNLLAGLWFGKIILSTTIKTSFAISRASLVWMWWSAAWAWCFAGLLAALYFPAFLSFIIWSDSVMLSISLSLILASFWKPNIWILEPFRSWASSFPAFHAVPTLWVSPNLGFQRVLSLLTQSIMPNMATYFVTSSKAGIKISAGQRAWLTKFYLLPFQNSLLSQKWSVIFSWTAGKDFVRDTSKALETVQTTFKRMPHCFTDDDLVITLCLIYISFHQSITDVEC